MAIDTAIRRTPDPGEASDGSRPTAPAGPLAPISGIWMLLNHYL
jgi:hypothetical protein